MNINLILIFILIIFIIIYFNTLNYKNDIEYYKNYSS
jgi:hypothetical protein